MGIESCVSTPHTLSGGFMLGNRVLCILSLPICASQSLNAFVILVGVSRKVVFGTNLTFKWVWGDFHRIKLSSRDLPNVFIWCASDRNVLHSGCPRRAVSRKEKGRKLRIVLFRLLDYGLSRLKMFETLCISVSSEIALHTYMCLVRTH